MSTPDDPARRSRPPCDCAYCAMGRLVAERLKQRDPANKDVLAEVCLALGFLQADIADAAPDEATRGAITRMIARGAAERGRQHAERRTRGHACQSTVH